MFTQNQVRQFYVANSYVSGNTAITAAGQIKLKQSNDSKYFWFEFMDADGHIIRTDLIEKSKLSHITLTRAADMARKTKATYVKLSDNVMEDDKVVPGQDFILNIRINQLNWHSDHNWGWKYGAVHSSANMSASDFYKEMAASLVRNMSRDPQKLLNVYLVQADQVDPEDVFESSNNVPNSVLINKPSDVYSVTTAYAIVIDEAEQPWRLGMMTQEPVMYEVHGDNVYVDGEETKWSDEETVIPGNLTIPNTKKIADMEWFYHGERGDIYRDSAWPNNWPNQMLTDMSSTYDTIDIHYYWNGANHAVQKSEKDITIACKPAATSSLVGAINTAASVSVDTSKTNTVHV